MRITVLAKTNAKKTGVSVRADGSLLVAVHALPEKWKANKAIEKAIAEHYHVPPTSVRIVAGKTTKRKVMEILGK